MTYRHNRQVRTLVLAALFGTTLFISGCNKHDESSHAPAAAAAADEETAFAITHFSDKTELFVEFVRLAVGRESSFAAHMTTLSDFKPVSAGKMTITLSGAGQPDETFTVDAPARAGIFRPVATPRHVGQRNVTFRLVTPTFTSVHEVGPVTVYASKEAAMKAQAAEKPDGPGAISYLKEQQWQTDYGLTAVAKRPLRAAVAATGTLRAPASHDAQLTAIAAGQVSAAGSFPRVGMKVKQGDVLAYLVPRLGGDTDVATLEVAAQKARIAAQAAGRERERLEALYQQEAVPEKRVSTARSEESLARADLAGAERRLGMYRKGGAGGAGIAIRAPISGTVAEVSVAPGGYINEGQPLLHIADSERLWLEVRVAESDLGRIGQPSGASFSVDGFETPFEVSERSGGRVVGFGNVIDPVTRSAPLLFEFANPDQRLRIGMAVRASVFSGKATEVIAIPATALIDDNGQSVVYVQRGGEAFERRAVQLGMRDGEWVEIRSGVAVGERVVSKGAYQVRLAATAPAAMGEGHVH
ncbi:efflux RND transporter periplasmic adaptor subunit [Massilia sp. CCM 8695]|uniref:Efflux RND transporter periplasmic adaptor subunit n=1 Tax=Massilia frigida TaxID=2609281 RepID=A0ABX0NA25_9BURK|nr:efflux RND transporter periplasmic adaptor subunit [Massilia frigida]NHZ82277.1 efflux RND transporter periplasmic adaptor subunit [Massilia frigida]